MICSGIEMMHVAKPQQLLQPLFISMRAYYGCYVIDKLLLLLCSLCRSSMISLRMFWLALECTAMTHRRA
jgi:hypothetical protein